ncbi:hypothetical protein KW797_00330 [Candidatus Parcubacteria bacterium]|nr:hypothetical protein [Candidatus Parcubacteria bacterium]
MKPYPLFVSSTMHLAVSAAMVGCASVSQQPQATTKPEILYAEPPLRTQTSISVRASVGCEGPAEKWLVATAESSVEPHSAIGKHTPCVPKAAGTSEKDLEMLDVEGLRPGTCYRLELFAWNSYSKEVRKWERACTLPIAGAPNSIEPMTGDSDEVRSLKAQLTALSKYNERPLAAGKTFFADKGECAEAVLAKAYAPYVPKDLKNKEKMPLVLPGDQTRFREKYRQDLCVKMDTVQGSQWVVQPAGVAFRVEVANGARRIYARDDCGNKVESAFAPLDEEKKRLETALAAAEVRTGMQRTSVSSSSTVQPLAGAWSSQYTESRFAPSVPTPAREQESGFCRGAWQLPCQIAGGIATIVVASLILRSINDHRSNNAPAQSAPPPSNGGPGVVAQPVTGGTPAVTTGPAVTAGPPL